MRLPPLVRQLLIGTGGKGLLLAATLAVSVTAQVAFAAAAPSATAPDLVPVRTEIVKLTLSAPHLQLSGSIQARVQSNVAFRIDGKVTERRVEVGQRVKRDQVLALLDQAGQQADVDNAQAGLNSAEALLQQAQTTYGRQKTLIDSGYTTRANFDSADASLKANQARVEAARADLSTAQEQLSYTELKAGADGIIVSRSVEAGQVVQAGQTIYVLAEDGPRDAVFDIFEALLTKPPKTKTVDVMLQADPDIKASGEVREISPTVDPVTSTVKVKIGLAATPPEMTLGAAVIGRARWEAAPTIELPWSALFECQGRPAVWIVDPADQVTCKTVVVAGYAAASVILTSGLEEGDRVVTAGGQFLYPGQKVAVTKDAGP